MSNSLSYQAVIFDLDGIITRTALVHSTAWTAMFNDYLHSRSERFGEKHAPFTHTADYLPFVDGKPRYKGVKDFLASRQIELPEGDPSDSPDAETICGLGNRKNSYFNEILERDGVEVYPSTIGLMDDLKKSGIPMAVASSSKNCRQVLERAGLLHFFGARVDGEVSAELGLKGKPEPDIFLLAADRLGVSYARSVVVEDANSGVEAGRKGGFGLVLGVAREENENALLQNGAHVVVKDLAEAATSLELDRIFRSFAAL